MNWASQPATALARILRERPRPRIRLAIVADPPGVDRVSESPPGSRSGGSAGLSGPWLESRRTAIPPVIDTFTEAWERGEAPVVEDYLHHLDPADSLGAVELIYREYCLAEADGRGPDPSSYLARFPQHREALERLLHLHGECPTSLLGRWFKPTAAEADLPEAGDSIGPYVLRRELGRGSFARVFLAEEADLENRLIVVKVSTRVTREPWLLARARHAHIVEIVWHTLVDDGAFQLICMPFFGGATLGAVLDVRREQSRAAASGRDLLDDLDRAAAPEYPGDHDARPARAMLARLSYDRAIAWIVARLAEALDHAFSRDVAHGDVKPSNILLSADGNPMLLDFNLARDGALVVDDPSRAVDPGGTLAYMAPERLRALASREPPLDDIVGRTRNRTRSGSLADRAGAASCRPLCAGHGLAGSADRPSASGGQGPGCPGPGLARATHEIGGAGLRGGPRAECPVDRPRLRNRGRPAHRNGPQDDPRTLPRSRPGPPVWPFPGAGRRPGPMANRPAAGLHRRAVLEADRPAMAASHSGGC